MRKLLLWVTLLLVAVSLFYKAEVLLPKQVESLPSPTAQTQLPAQNSAPSAAKAGTMVSKDFKWRYNYRTYKWHLEIPQNLVDWDREIYRTTESFYSGNKYNQMRINQSAPANIRALILANSSQSQGNLIPYITEPYNAQWIAGLARELADRARRDGYNSFYQAEFIQRFVCSIPYIKTTVAMLPAQTLIDNGDCKDKTILLGAMLRSLGYQVALLDFLPGNGQEGHMALGVAFNDNQVPKNRSLFYYLYNGKKYYYAETTEPGWKIGEASLKEPAYIYEVN